VFQVLLQVIGVNLRNTCQQPDFKIPNEGIMDHNGGDISFLRMDAESFERLSVYVTREYGIKLPLSKKSMLESRLNKMAKSMGMHSYVQFMDYIFSAEGKQTELPHVIDLITTNKTDFFREEAHFNFLAGDFLPGYLSGTNYHNLNIWSAGCSSGEEPYTLLMVLEEYKKRFPQISYNILASDISQRVIQSAHQGIYTLDKVTNISPELKRSYFLRSKKNPDLVRVRPEYRKKVLYKRINLMDSSFGILKGDYDIIFCRNVLIYFDKEKQEEVIRKFTDYLKPSGLLFLGHSESIIGMKVPLRQIRPTVYQLT
jgi:chemotaxis protein methyltransferase CheR